MVKKLYPAGEDQTNRARRTTERAARERPGTTYWLIAKNETGPIEVFTIDGKGEEGEEVLPVFSHQEEAEMFLWLGEVGASWHARESAAGELTSILYGPCSGVTKVVLDPLPKMLEEKTVSLVSLSQKRFIERILSGRRPLA